jgi:putative ABC transport system permease protein
MNWRRYLRRTRWDEERGRELDAYLAQETADNIARGMTADEAAHAARRKLGNVTEIREEIYRMNTIGWIETLWQDLRYASRVLRKSPGFTAVALLSVALGIGATTAIFSVVYGVLISPYPYAKPGEIWAPTIRDLKNPRFDRPFYSLREFNELRQLPAFRTVMATGPGSQLLTGDRAPENFPSVLVTANAFEFLGVAPVLGRTIGPQDVRRDGDAEHVIVLAYGAWQRLFDGRPDALGKTLTLDNEPYTVIGVMPPRFGWWTSEGGWLPMPMTTGGNLRVFPIVRLNAGVSKQAALDQLNALHRRLAEIAPKDFPKGGFTTGLDNYLDITVASGEMQSSLRLLFGAVGLLLLIGCANVANLQTARATSRAQEIAVRMSVGAGPGRVFRQLLTESVLLSVAGGVLGVLFGIGITRAVVALMPSFYVPNESRIEVNRYVLAFSAAVSVLTGIIFGLIPALRASRSDLVSPLKEAGRTSGAASAGGRTRGALVIVEIALSVILLIGASLAVRGFLKLQQVDLGFQPQRVLMVTLQLPPKRYSTYAQRVGFTERLLASLENLPGAQSVAIGNGGLPFGGLQTPFTIDGQETPSSRPMTIGLISAGYTRTLGITLRAGREISPQEVAHADHYALINETAATLWRAGSNPIGSRVRLDFLDRTDPNALAPPTPSPYVTIVGIIGDVRNGGLRNPVAPAAYIPYTLLAPANRMVAIRTAAEPMLLLNAVRHEVASLDKELPLVRPSTMETVLGFQTVQPRFNAALFTFFGVLGLALAAFGIYSVLSYTVARRTHEIGIRMALGAGTAEVLMMITSAGAKLVAIGLVTGLVTGLVIFRLVKSTIFGVPETDPLAIFAVVSVLAIVSLIACLIPGRRATRLDPMSALRQE